MRIVEFEGDFGQIFEVEPKRGVTITFNISLHLYCFLEMFLGCFEIFLAEIVVRDVVVGGGYVFRDGFFDGVADCQFFVVVADGVGMVAHFTEVASDPKKHLTLGIGLFFL
jgi:hypothetical protein